FRSRHESSFPIRRHGPEAGDRNLSFRYPTCHFDRREKSLAQGCEPETAAGGVSAGRSGFVVAEISPFGRNDRLRSNDRREGVPGALSARGIASGGGARNSMTGPTPLESKSRPEAASGRMVEPGRIELPTSSLRTTRSPS